MAKNGRNRIEILTAVEIFSRDTDPDIRIIFHLTNVIRLSNEETNGNNKTK